MMACRSTTQKKRLQASAGSSWSRTHCRMAPAKLPRCGVPVGWMPEKMTLPSEEALERCLGLVEKGWIRRAVGEMCLIERAEHRQVVVKGADMLKPGALLPPAHSSRVIRHPTIFTDAYDWHHQIQGTQEFERFAIQPNLSIIL